MKNFSRKACLFMCMLLISVSCRKEQESDIISPTVTSVTITEAQAWFDQNLANRTNQPERGSRTNQQKLKRGSKEPLWELAEESTTPEGKTLVVPLKYEQGKGPGKGTLSKLLITKDQHGQIAGQVMIALGDETYLKKNAYQLDASNFTGVIRIEDWQEQFIKGFWYENGEQKGKVEEKIAGSDSNKGGGTNAYSFTYMSTWYYRTCGYGYCSGWSVGGYDRYTIYVAN